DARRSEQAQAKKTSSSMASSNYTMADMERIELIGKGTYGEVWRTRVKATGREVALKMGSQKTELTREQCLLLDMDCPFVVRAEAIFSYEGAPCIIMPLLEGGDLDLHLGMTPEGYFSQERAMFHAAEILVGLDYLHSKGVVYRDLKPENVVLDAEGHTVLTDMGHARSLSATAYAETFCGTAEYLAPEILDANGHTHAVDHWALGVLLFEMICGTLPFSGPDIYGSILLKEPEFPDFVSPDARDLVSQLMRKQPAARPRSSQIRGHPFFSSLVWDNVEQRQYKPSFVPDLEVIRRLTRQQLRES
ncbi:RAC family serine/threonine-protein kinase-like protein, partial [Diplonema papillatum]